MPEAKRHTDADGETVRVTVADNDCSSVTETSSLSAAASDDDVLSSQTVSVTVPVLHCANVSATSSYTARLRTNLVFMFATYKPHAPHQCSDDLVHAQKPNNKQTCYHPQSKTTKTIVLQVSRFLSTESSKQILNRFCFLLTHQIDQIWVQLLRSTSKSTSIHLNTYYFHHRDSYVLGRSISIGWTWTNS